MGFQSDHYYVDKVIQGDVNAYAKLVEKHKDMVYTIAHRITRNREDAEEIAQDAFLKAFEHLKDFKKQSKFSTWIYRIAYNAAISRIRKKSLETTLLDENLIGGVPEEQVQQDMEGLEVDEQREMIDMALEQLNELDYLLITMFYLKEKSIDDIAEITGLSKSNVKVKLHRIRKKMYQELYSRLGEKISVPL
jgi:RNA polymerase sigma-70 factor (ECF subfamily)